MAQTGRLFDPPPKPQPQLSDEQIALKVVRWLQRWAKENAGFEDEDVSDKEVNELVEAMMATNSRKWKTILQWIRENRERSEWKWEHYAMLLEWKYSEACDAILPQLTDGKSQ